MGWRKALLRSADGLISEGKSLVVVDIAVDLANRNRMNESNEVALALMTKCRKTRANGRLLDLLVSWNEAAISLMQPSAKNLKIACVAARKKIQKIDLLDGGNSSLGTFRRCYERILVGFFALLSCVDDAEAGALRNFASHQEADWRQEVTELLSFIRLVVKIHVDASYKTRASDFHVWLSANRLPVVEKNVQGGFEFSFPDGYYETLEAAVAKGARPQLPSLPTFAPRNFLSWCNSLKNIVPRGVPEKEVKLRNSSIARFHGLQEWSHTDVVACRSLLTAIEGLGESSIRQAFQKQKIIDESRVRGGSDGFLNFCKKASGFNALVMCLLNCEPLRNHFVKVMDEKPTLKLQDHLALLMAMYWTGGCETLPPRAIVGLSNVRGSPSQSRINFFNEEASPRQWLEHLCATNAFGVDVDYVQDRDEWVLHVDGNILLIIVDCKGAVPDSRPGYKLIGITMPAAAPAPTFTAVHSVLADFNGDGAAEALEDDMRKSASLAFYAPVPANQ